MSRMNINLLQAATIILNYGSAPWNKNLQSYAIARYVDMFAGAVYFFVWLNQRLLTFQSLCTV